MSKGKIVIFGHKGMLGQDLCKEVPPEWSLNGNDLDVDITNPEAIQKTMKKDDPDRVINAVAYNDVDGAQTHQDTATRVNAQGLELPRGLPRGNSSFSFQFSITDILSGIELLLKSIRSTLLK